VLRKVNEILGDHNVDKQISDSRGDNAYLMADISSIKYEQIKDIYDSLETLSGKLNQGNQVQQHMLMNHAQLAS
jgi:D-3-phosphoglycerate dehydrogenase